MQKRSSQLKTQLTQLEKENLKIQACWDRLHTLLHVVGCCCVLLRKV